MTTATAPRQLAALLVAHAQLVPSLTNPRKRFDKDRLEELALSMAPPVGILEPLVVRRLAVERAMTMKLNPPDQFYEIIAGERRWRAAAIAKLEEIPVVVREIADDQVIKLQLVENKNREDIHPLDEAEAMDRLLKMNKAETPKTIAATIGMSERYVQNRLHYIRLAPVVKEAFRTDEITAGHVDRLMRLPVDEQTRAFKDGLYDQRFDYDNDTGKNTKHLELRSVRGLGDWIDANVRLPLDAKSPQLELLPDVAQAVTESSVAGAPTLIELSENYGSWQGKGPAPLDRNKWVSVKPNDKCDSQVRGVIVIGRRRGTILTVCTGVGVCKKHFAHTVREKPKASAAGQKTAPPKKSAAEIKWAKQRAERLAREKQWKTLEPKAKKLVREHIDRLKPGADAYSVIGAALGLGLPKKPTLAQLVTSAIEDNFYGPDDFEHLAGPLGIDVKKFYDEAERQARFGKMSDQEAGAAAIRAAAKGKDAPAAKPRAGVKAAKGKRGAPAAGASSTKKRKAGKKR